MYNVRNKVLILCASDHFPLYSDRPLTLHLFMFSVPIVPIAAYVLTSHKQAILTKQLQHLHFTRKPCARITADAS